MCIFRESQNMSGNTLARGQLIHIGSTTAGFLLQLFSSPWGMSWLQHIPACTGHALICRSSTVSANRRFKNISSYCLLLHTYVVEKRPIEAPE
jgi:hypothetical protein